MDLKQLFTFDELCEIIENFHDEVMIFDDDYQIVYVNKACQRHYGKPQQNFIHKKFNEVEGVFWNNSTLPEVYEHKKVVAKRQFTNLGTDIITISVPLLDENNNIKYVLQDVNDIYWQNTLSPIEEPVLNIVKGMTGDGGYLTQNKKVQEMLAMLERIKDVNTPCLLLGETGTGKSYLAKYLHDLSIRNHQPFVSVNCACMSPQLMESELFGYKKGAFSGASGKGKKGIVELADGGTLFLDEISEIPVELQSKLLHFIETQEFLPVGGEHKQKVDVRIIAATNRVLEEMVQENTFREDLYYRLNSFEFTIPPLRERPEDIRLFAEHFLNTFNKKHFRNHTLHPSVLETFLHYYWPGNVREIEHVMEKLVVLSEEREITKKSLPKMFFRSSGRKTEKQENTISEGMNIAAGSTLGEALEAVEKAMIVDSYNRHYNSVKVAKELGISQSKAYRLIKKYVLDV